MENQAFETQPLETTPEPVVNQKRGSGFWRFLLDIVETIVLSAIFLSPSTPYLPHP
jgi:hypothetical protein